MNRKQAIPLAIAATIFTTAVARAEQPTWYIADLDKLDCATISGRYGSGVDTPEQYIDLIYHRRVRKIQETGPSGATSVRVMARNASYTDAYFSQSYADCRAEIPKMGAERRKWAEGTGLLDPNFTYQFRGESGLQ